MKRTTRKQPAWRSALLRKGASAVAKRAHLPLPLVKRIKAGTAKVSAKTERKLYNAHRQIRYAALRKAGADPRTAKRESGIRDPKKANVRLKLLRAGANDKNLDAYETMPSEFVEDLAKRYKQAVKLIWENAKATRDPKHRPTFAQVAAGVRKSGRIFAIDDLERYVKPYQRGQSVKTPSGGTRHHVHGMLRNINRYIYAHWEQLSDLNQAYRDLWENTRLLDVVASSDSRWQEVKETAVRLRQECANKMGTSWEPEEEEADENT